MTRIYRLFLLAAAILGMTPGLNAQVTGGQHAFEFLTMSNSPRVSALGGLAPAGMGKEVSFTFQNPALLQPGYHNQLSLNYNLYYAGISIANIAYAYHVAPLKTDFALGVQYLNYGTFDQTDLFGNKQGQIHAADYSINLSASRKYRQHWRYGATIRLANSSLGGKAATAALMDVGIVYEDTANLLTIGLVARNMGFVLRKYNPDSRAEPLPFDLQLGITKQLKNVPLRIFMVAHHLYQWDIRYDNPADIVNTDIFGNAREEQQDKSYFVDKLFRHLNFGAELLIGKRLLLTGAYSHLRRQELGYDAGKGLAGFSFGLGVRLNKLSLHYARSYYATAGAYNEFGLNVQLNKFFGIGKKTEPWGWDKVY